jgi:hypothetical protein
LESPDGLLGKCEASLFLSFRFPILLRTTYSSRRKRIMNRLVSLAIFVSLLPGMLEAQLIPSTARELVSVAVTTARRDWASDAYLQNVLFAGGSQAGITLSLDAATGKANVWVYGMYSPSLDSTKFFIASNVPIVGPTAIAAPVSVSIPALPIGGHLELVDPFIDSPAALQAARDAGAAAFLQSHPSAIVDVAAAVNNPDELPVLPKGRYWIFRFNDGTDQYACWVNAVNGSPAQCGTVTSSGTLPAPALFRLYPVAPHPVRLSASPEFIARYELAASQAVRLHVHDVLGREIAAIDPGLMSAGVHQIALRTQLFSHPGLYMLTLSAQAGYSAQKLLVVD